MGLDYSDARHSYFNLFTEPRTPRRMLSWNPAGAACNCNWGAAAEADASGEHAAAVEAGAIGKQQLEADANEEQQLTIGPGSSS